MTTVKDLIARLKANYHPNEHVAAGIWQTDDILARTKDRQMHVDRDVAVQIVEQMANNHDASVGISWDTVDVYLDLYGD